MSRETTAGRDLLRYLREKGFTIRPERDRLVISPASRLTGDLRATILDVKPEMLSELRREEIEQLLDLAPVDPETGLPNLPADEPATMRQVERLRELAEHPAFGEHRERVGEVVETALEKGLSQLGAYGLLGELGRRIAERGSNE